jgi:8-oxo-dGTP pyrophosphatase MutT (NUDIX family)
MTQPGSETPFINADDAGRALRLSVRALLFNPAGELLLIKYRANPDIHLLGHAPVLADNWGTAGGGIDPGEAFHPALYREVAEEIGHTNIAIGPLVWHRRADMVFKGQDMRLDERYFVVHTPDSFIRTEAHTEYERSYILDARWWKPRDIVATDEVILPPFLRRHIMDLAAGRYPPEVMVFDETRKI